MIGIVQKSERNRGKKENCSQKFIVGASNGKVGVEFSVWSDSHRL